MLSEKVLSTGLFLSLKCSKIVIFIKHLEFGWLMWFSRQLVSLFKHSLDQLTLYVLLLLGDCLAHCLPKRSWEFHSLWPVHSDGRMVILTQHHPPLFFFGCFLLCCYHFYACFFNYEKCQLPAKIRDCHEPHHSLLSLTYGLSHFIHHHNRSLTPPPTQITLK